MSKKLSRPCQATLLVLGFNIALMVAIAITQPYQDDIRAFFGKESRSIQHSSD